ncbi:MAG TPA: ribose-5-phosphate isomerase RpiA [Polyangia bacterium]|jgi:ribose 5-phosphate isomerase A
MTLSSDPPAGLAAIAARALELVEDGTTVGLGSGRAASAFITALGARVRDGLKINAVPTSDASAELARRLGIPLVGIEEDVELALTVDGADEVAPNLDIVKGRGGALVRERIVAAASRRQVILIGPDKLVAHLGERGTVPVEFVPMAEGLVLRRLKGLTMRPALRQDATTARPFVTDNGNRIFDCQLARPLGDGGAARAMEAAIRAIVGVVDTGLFLGTAERVLVGHLDGRVDVLTRGAS